MIEGIEIIKNNVVLFPVDLHKCDRCGEPIYSNYPREIRGDKEYCGDCAFLEGYISEDELLRDYYYFVDSSYMRALIIDGDVVVDVETDIYPDQRRRQRKHGNRNI